MQDLQLLEVIWELAEEWQSSWDVWKAETFECLQTNSMTLQAQALLKRLNKVAREVKVRKLAYFTSSTYVCACV